MRENPPAFPSETNTRFYHGMSLRDYFAGQVAPQVVADIASGALSPEEDGRSVAQVVAENAYILADAMLEHREKSS